MPSNYSSINQRDDGDVLVSIGQKAKIVVPPVMKTKTITDQLCAGTTILPADSSKYYVIHAYVLSVENSAATACTYMNLQAITNDTGENVTIDRAALVANQVNRSDVRMSGLNFATMPGKQVYVQGDADPNYRFVKVYYTEVPI